MVHARAAQLSLGALDEVPALPKVGIADPARATRNVESKTLSRTRLARSDAVYPAASTARALAS